MFYFILSVTILALMLFFPISKLIWVLNVRYLQRKQQRELSEPELQEQLLRARFISFFIVIGFSLIFNLHLLD